MNNQPRATADTVMDRLLRDPRVLELLQGLEQVIGIKLTLAWYGAAHEALDAWGYTESRGFPLRNRHVHSSSRVARRCLEVRSGRRAAASGPARALWPAGLLHAATAISNRGEPVGFLVVLGLPTGSVVNADSSAQFQQFLAGSEEYRSNRCTPALLGSLVELKRHRGPPSGSALPLMAAVAFWIQEYASSLPLHRETPLPAPLYRAMEYSKKHHASEMLTMAKAAEEAGVTPQRLAQLFRGHMGVTFTAWLAGYRVSKAMERLRIGRERVLDVAMTCGFGTVSSLNRSFRKVTGSTPSEYRLRRSV